MQSNKKVYPKYETKKGQLKPGEKVHRCCSICKNKSALLPVN
jgi:hypothetical protein